MAKSEQSMINALQNRRMRKFDKMTGIPISIDYGHHEIHGGSSFRCAASIASGVAASLSLSFKTGPKPMHINFAWRTESKAHFTVREGGSWTTNTGTAVDIINKRRNSDRESGVLEDKSDTPAFAATMAMLQDVTSPTGGTVLTPLSDISWSSKNKGIEGERSVDEFILAEGTNYTVALTSDDGNKGMAIFLDWYEHL